MTHTMCTKHRNDNINISRDDAEALCQKIASVFGLGENSVVAKMLWDDDTEKIDGNQRCFVVIYNCRFNDERFQFLESI